MTGERRAGSIGQAAEEVYYESRTPEVMQVIASRDEAIALMKEGDIRDAYHKANSSSRGAKSACAEDPTFARERYASDATCLRIGIVGGSLFWFKDVKQLADFEPPFTGLDQYEVMFRPVISAALSLGRR